MLSLSNLLPSANRKLFRLNQRIKSKVVYWITMTLLKLSLPELTGVDQAASMMVLKPHVLMGRSIPWKWPEFLILTSLVTSTNNLRLSKTLRKARSRKEPILLALAAAQNRLDSRLVWMKLIQPLIVLQSMRKLKWLEILQKLPKWKLIRKRLTRLKNELKTKNKVVFSQFLQTS